MRESLEMTCAKRPHFRFKSLGHCSEVIASVHGMDADPNKNQFLADLIRFFKKVVCFSRHTLTNRILDYRFDCIKGGCWALGEVCAFLSALSGLEVSVNTLSTNSMIVSRLRKCHSTTAATDRSDPVVACHTKRKKDQAHFIFFQNSLP